MARLFISYSRKDQVFARRLAESLAAAGLDVWIDLEDIPAGIKWSRAIQDGLTSSDVLLVIVSPDSMTSANVEDEWQYFLDKRKPVIPVLLKPAEMHFQLNRLQYIDFDTQEYDQALRQLQDELRRQGLEAAASAPPDPAPVTHQPEPRPTDGRRRWVVVGAAGIVIAVLGLLASRGDGGAADVAATLSAQNTRIAQLERATQTFAAVLETPSSEPTLTLSPTSAASPTPAVEGPPVSVTSDCLVQPKAQINVRSGPGGAYRDIGDLPAGSSTQVLGRGAEGTGLQINFDTGAYGGTAWVTSDPQLVTLVGDCDNLPEVDVTPQATGLEGFTGQILFVSDRNGTDDIHLVNADSSSPYELFDHTGSDYDPAWSPDGRRIAFVSDQAGNNDIWLMDDDGENLLNISHNPADDLEPAWSPDGEQIVFVSDREGNPEIYVMSADGADVIRLTFHEAEDTTPSWSPDGQYIIYNVKNPDGTVDIYRMSPDGQNDINLTGGTGNFYTPVWSPQGDRILYASDASGRDGLHIMDADGENPQFLSSTEGDVVGGACWSPDGRAVAYVAQHDDTFAIYIVEIASEAIYRLPLSDVVFSRLSWRR